MVQVVEILPNIWRHGALASWTNADILSIQSLEQSLMKFELKYRIFLKKMILYDFHC